MVWWFPLSSEQYRFQGRFHLIYPQESDQSEPALGLDQERLEAWKKLSPPAKAQFYWPQPGVSHSGLQEDDSCGDVEEDAGPPPSNFLLLVLKPTKVHYLRLKDNFAALETLSDGGWSWQRVNP